MRGLFILSMGIDPQDPDALANCASHTPALPVHSFCALDTDGVEYDDIRPEDLAPFLRNIAPDAATIDDVGLDHLASMGNRAALGMLYAIIVGYDVFSDDPALTCTEAAGILRDVLALADAEAPQ